MNFWETSFRKFLDTAPGDTKTEKLNSMASMLQKILDEEKQKENERSKRYETELEAKLIEIHNRMVRDFNSNQKRHSNWTTTIDGLSHFHYSFINGDILDLDEEGILYITLVGKGTTKYTLSGNIKSKFTNTTNAITRKKEEKDREKKYQKTNYDKYADYDDFFNDDFFNDDFWNQFRSKFGSSYGSKSDSFNSGFNPNSNTNSNKSHPKWKVYESLTITIKSRREQLAKMTKNDPDRAALQNELDSAIGIVEEMKKKYNFE